MIVAHAVADVEDLAECARCGVRVAFPRRFALELDDRIVCRPCGEFESEELYRQVFHGKS